jgi:K(+)-stimulated pyrophosphate-energized sodium pump
MKLLNHAVRQDSGRKTPRIWALLLVVVGAIFPQMAFAAEGDNVKLAFTGSDRNYLIISLVLGVVALAYAVYVRSGVMRHSPGSEKMQAVGLAIRDGALAYLRQQVATMSIFVVILAVALFLYYRQTGTMFGVVMAVCFIGGVAASYVAGYSGMLMAVAANMRTAHAALSSYKRALEVSFRAGAVAGMVTVGMGLIGATLILMFGGEHSMNYLIGFGFGGSLAALFMRVGGGIFTKAADVGADLVGKVEAGIPEDDPRNPATIADNVGDNVGDCAGMAADIFESYEVTLVAAIILGAATAAIFDQSTWMRLILFALMARGVGILASIIGIGMVRGSDDLDSDPLMAIRKGFYASAAIALVFTGVLAYFMMGGQKANEIVTQSLTSTAEVQKQDVATIKKIISDIAAKKKIEPDKVEAKDVVADARAKALGLTDQDEAFIGSVRQLNDADIPAPPLEKYTALSNSDLSDPSNVVGNYAVRAPMKADAAVDPQKQFVSIASLFSSAGSKYVIAKVHQTVNQPATPAQNGMPAQPAQKREFTGWVGPIESKDLDDKIKQFQESAKQQKPPIDVQVEILSREPVKLFATPTGDLAIGVTSNVQRPYTLAQGLGDFSYYKMSAADVNKLVNAAATTSTPPSLPSQFQPKLVVVNSAAVPWWCFWLAIGFGVVMAFAIEMLTDYYVSTHKRPVQEVAGVATAGPAPMIIQGFAYAAESSVFMVFAIVIALMFPLFLFNPATYGGYILSFYGIALVGLGLLTTTGYVLAMDTFGPISDNAQGVYEMSGEGHDNIAGSKAVQRLDAAGNTTKALTKGFAITTAVVAAVALFHSYLDSAKLDAIGLRLDVPEIFLGLLIGGAAPFLFTAFSINAVGRASFQLINEVRRQFRSDPGIMAGTSRPDYARCVAIVTAAAQKELLGPGILAIALPVAVGFGFSIGKPTVNIAGTDYNLVGAQALGGFLAGAILSGQLLAVLLANSGGMWDNAKKLIEDGLHGGKGTEAHKAGVVCDTVGDPFKDTAGPALNPLIKVMNLVGLLLAPAIIQAHTQNTLITVTVISVILLAISIWFSKKGSMSTAMTAAQASGAAADEHFSHPVAAAEAHELPSTPKRKILVEEEEEPPTP